MLFRLSLLMMVLFFPGGSGPEEQEAKPEAAGCECLPYQAKDCPCNAESPCTTCSPCSGDESCDCVRALEASTGTIEGQVKSRWLRRVSGVVYVEAIAGRSFEPRGPEPVMDQKNLIFRPHVLPVLVGSNVKFPNSDSVRHNVFSPPSAAKQFNLGTYDAGVVKEVTFEDVGVVPLLCNVHSEMSAYVVVCPTPFFATVGRQGSFKLENVPPGEHRVTFWHEKLEPKTITVRVEKGSTAKVTFDDLKRD